MAVVPMKLVNIVGPRDRFDAFVLSCIVNREFHPESAAEVITQVKHLLPFHQDNPYTSLLAECEQLASRCGIALDFCAFDAGSMNGESIRDYLKGLSDHYDALVRERDEIQRIISDDEQIIIQLENIKNLKTRLENFFSMTYVKFRYGRLMRETYHEFREQIEEMPGVYFFNTSETSDTVYCMYLTPRSCGERIDSFFASIHFERIRISDRASGEPMEAIENLTREIAASKERLRNLNVQIDVLKKKNTDKFLSCYSYIKYMNEAHAIRRFAAHTEDSFYLVGWVPQDQLKSFTSALSAFPDLTYVIEPPGSIPQLVPPVKLKNRGFFKYFEDFVVMYGLPSYNELDPTCLLTLSYMLLFGIMFGDVGQGAVLILLGIAAWKLMKMRIGRIISCVGISSVLFGFFYGSVFGSEDLLPGFKVMETPETTNITLIAAIGIGLILITIAFVFNIVNGIRQKNYEKVFFSQNGLAGLVFYWAVIIGVLMLFFVGVNLFTVGYLIVLVVIPLLLIFFKEPLGKLAKKRPDWKPESIGDYILVNLFEMLEILLSFVTNTISFVRVGAFALSHVGMMMVVYLLAAGANGSHNLIVLIIGNIIVIALEGLIVGIQVLRLEFYELFGRFYSGDGRPYRPIHVDYKVSGKNNQ